MKNRLRTLGVTLGTGACFALSAPAQSQMIQVDGTTPTTPGTCLGSCLITGGTQVGNNLYHSFSRFNVDPGQFALFDDPGVANIISRVTGGNLSRIDGMLGVWGDANLFLLNPSGILFGPDASLFVNGAFVASTADTLELANGDRFSTHPGVPFPSQVLSVDPSALLMNQIAPPEPIVVDRSILRVPDGQLLLLAGGEVQLDGATLEAPAGMVGIVGLGQGASMGFAPGLPTSGNLANVRIANSYLGVNSDLFDSGLIQMQAGEVRISDSTLTASNDGTGAAGTVQLTGQTLVDLSNSEISSIANNDSAIFGKILLEAPLGSLALNQAFLSAQNSGSGFAGDISLSARDRVDIRNSVIFSDGNLGQIFVGASGYSSISPLAVVIENSTLDTSFLGGGGSGAGGIRIQAIDTLNVTNSQIFSDTFGDGSAGSVALQAGTIAVNNGHLTSEGLGNATGDAGNISITADRDSLTLQGSVLSTETPTGGGTPGSITLRGRDQVTINDTFLTSSSDSDGSGFGTIDVASETGSVLLDAAWISSTNFGLGIAGDISITAPNQITIHNDSRIFSEGDSGQIFIGSNVFNDIVPRTVTIDNSELNTTESLGIGFAGSVNITASDRISITNSSRISSEGDSGRIFVGGNLFSNATPRIVEIDNSELNTTESLGIGFAGSVNITASDRVSVVNNSRISSQGTGGEIVIGAGWFSSVSPQTILIQDANFNTENFGDGTAGNISLTASDRIDIFNSQLFSDTYAAASAGNISLQAGTIALTEGWITSEGVGNATGDAGNIAITADRGSLTLQQSTLSTETPTGGGTPGNITLRGRDQVTIANTGLNSRSDNDGFGFGTIDVASETGSVLLDAARISTTNFGTGIAGDISITAPNQIAILNDSRIFSEGDSGRIFIGGNIFNAIVPRTVLIADSELNTTDNLGIGFAGSISIAGTDSVSIVNSWIFSRGNQGVISVGASDYSSISPGEVTIADSELNTENINDGVAGDIRITARDGITVGNSRLYSDTFGVADAGSITLETPGNVSISNSDLTSETFPSSTGNAGAIGVFARNIFLSNGTRLVTNTAGSGNAGGITILAKDTFSLDGSGTGLFANTAPDSTGNGGNIFIDPALVRVRNGASISVNSQGRGNAGSIELYAGQLELDRQASITASTASGEGGNILLQVDRFLLMRNNSLIAAEAGGTGNGGNLDIAAEFVIAVPRENSDINANAFQGQGGNINITTQGLFGYNQGRQTPQSDITASSQFGINGVIQVNSPDVNVENDLASLAEGFVDPDRVVAGSCIARRGAAQGSFTVTGSGGLPKNPYDAPSSNYSTTTIQPITREPDSSPTPPPQNSPQTIVWKVGDPIQEARGMVRTPEGQQVLARNPRSLAVAKASDFICSPETTQQPEFSPLKN